MSENSLLPIVSWSMTSALVVRLLACSARDSGWHSRLDYMVTHNMNAELYASELVLGTGYGILRNDIDVNWSAEQ